MNTMFRLFLLAALAVTVVACKKEEAAKPAAAAPAPVVMPTDPNDTAAWKQYLVGIAKQNMEGVRQRPYMYYVPAGEDEAAMQQYDLQLQQVSDVVGRGVLPGNMIAFGSPNSTRMADLIVEAFTIARSGSLKEVRILFIGAAADEARVREAVTPSGAEFVFVEAK